MARWEVARGFKVEVFRLIKDRGCRMYKPRSPLVCISRNCAIRRRNLRMFCNPHLPVKDR
jgi:hypothetical protein